MPRKRLTSSQTVVSGEDPLGWRSRHAQSKSLFSGEVITVLVSHSNVPFHIHQNLLSTSTYFSNIINGPWKESQGEILIEHVHPEIFEVYITWIYTKKITISGELDIDDKFTFLHHTYVFGDYVQDQAFRDAILENVIVLVKEKRIYPHHLAELVYQQTMESSPWRRLYIDLWLCSMDDDNGTAKQEWADVQHGPKEFFVDLLNRQSSSLFKRKRAERGMEYVEKRRGSGRPRRVQPPALSYHQWRM